MVLVVHPHFHRRRTGITSHIETVVPELGKSLETTTLGRGLSSELPSLSWGQLWKRLRKEPVVWHAHRVNELGAGLLLRLFSRRLKLVFTRHASVAPGLLTRMLASRADLVVSLTQQVASAVGLPSTIISHGVDLNRYAPPMDRAAAWRTLGVGGSFGIGVIGRIRPDKGQGDFVEALRPLLPLYRDWRAVLVGLAKPKDQAWLDALTRNTPLTLPGERADVVPWYQGLSILVHPSHNEAYSMVLLEALAAGCCVVASKLPHVPDVVEHGRTGMLYPPGDIQALREILEPLLRAPERARRLGQQAAEEARRRFGVEHEARSLSESYRRLHQTHSESK